MRYSSLFSFKEVGVAVLLSFAATCAVAAVSERSAAQGVQTAPISLGTITVDRTNKGDRLPQMLPLSGRPLSGGPPPASPAAPGAIPVGCDRAFSPIVNPAHADVYLRCLS
jgi:hypothetical protein